MCTHYVKHVNLTLEMELSMTFHCGWMPVPAAKLSKLQVCRKKLNQLHSGSWIVLRRWLLVPIIDEKLVRNIGFPPLKVSFEAGYVSIRKLIDRRPEEHGRSRRNHIPGTYQSVCPE